MNHLTSSSATPPVMWSGPICLSGLIDRVLFSSPNRTSLGAPEDGALYSTRRWVTVQAMTLNRPAEMTVAEDTFSVPSQKPTVQLGAHTASRLATCEVADLLVSGMW